jgi:hypothetical protein
MFIAPQKTGLVDLWDKYGPPDLCRQAGPGNYVCD